MIYLASIEFLHRNKSYIILLGHRSVNHLARVNLLFDLQRIVGELHGLAAADAIKDPFL
jgi:hypothetical protein